MSWLYDRDSFILNKWILLKVVGRVKRNYFYKESVIIIGKKCLSITTKLHYFTRQFLTGSMFPNMLYETALIM